MGQKVVRAAARVMIVTVCAFGALSCKTDGNRWMPGLVSTREVGKSKPDSEGIATDSISVKEVEKLHYLNSTRRFDMVMHTQPWGDGRHVCAEIGQLGAGLDVGRWYLDIGFVGSTEPIARILIDKELARIGNRQKNSLVIFYAKKNEAAFLDGQDGEVFFLVVPYTWTDKGREFAQGGKIMEVRGTPDGKDWQTRTLTPVE